MKKLPPARVVAVVSGLALLSTLFAGEPDARWVAKQADRLRAGDTDAWREIPWAKSLTAAASAARDEGRPLFVFSHEGNIDTGRC